MSESLRDLLLAKAGTLSLVGATALVTTALVGGGAVAVSTVSNETTTAAKAAAQAGQQGEAQRSATATAVLKEKPAREKPRTPIACGDAGTHGAFVSSTAQSLPKGAGRGEAVSAAARSDCGKPAGQPAAADKPGKPDKPSKPGQAGPPAGKGKNHGKGKTKD